MYNVRACVVILKFHFINECLDFLCGLEVSQICNISAYLSVCSMKMIILFKNMLNQLYTKYVHPK